MKNISFDYNIHKQRICEAAAWVEQTLIKDGTFALPSKRALVIKNAEIRVLIVDAAECETERPKKNSGNHTPASKNTAPSKSSS